MKYPERTAIVEKLPYEARLGFMAFCIERCLHEAERHPAAREQLENLPWLKEGVDMIWARAEQGKAPEAQRTEAILAHIETLEQPAPDMENVLYNADITLVQAARMLRKGLKALRSPEQANPRYVAGALEGPVQSVGTVYTDWQSARQAEVAVTDTALERLAAANQTPFSRTVFEGIADWKRGKVSTRYAEGRVKGSSDEDG
jgi:hypothetical protein